MTHKTGRRGALLLVIGGLVFGLVACGRASESELLSAVGITPTATQSPQEIATVTAIAVAQQTAAAGTPAVDIAALGDVESGRRIFNDQGCINCHRPGGGGTGSDLLAPGGPGASLTLESLTVLVREAPNDHPPGPYRSFEITDRSIGDLAAYILAESQS